jgi:hypothetical protein
MNFIFRAHETRYDTVYCTVPGTTVVHTEPGTVVPCCSVCRNGTVVGGCRMAIGAIDRKPKKRATNVPVPGTGRPD